MTTTASPKVIDVLACARALIADPAHHCKGTFAIDASGRITHRLKSAVRFCALGALRRAILDLYDKRWDDIRLPPVYSRAIDALVRERWPVDRAWVCGADLATINDAEGHEAIIELFDKAIVLSKPDIT